jgi:hypothetical protein
MRCNPYFRLALAYCAVASLYIHSASAAVNETDGIVLIPDALSARENGASIATVISGGTITSSCASLVYIAPEDKELLATALSAQIAGIHVSIRYDDAASPVSLGAFVSGGVVPTVSCKLLGVWAVKAGY